MSADNYRRTGNDEHHHSTLILLDLDNTLTGVEVKIIFRLHEIFTKWPIKNNSDFSTAFSYLLDLGNKYNLSVNLLQFSILFYWYK